MNHTHCQPNVPSQSTAPTSERKLIEHQSISTKPELTRNREVKRSVSNGEILRDLTTYLCCVDPYPQSQQRHKIDNLWNKAK